MTRRRSFFIILCSLILLAGSVSSHSQKIKSNTVRFRLNNMASEEMAVEDREPPVVRIITPEIREGAIFQTDQEDLDLIGEVRDRGKVRFVSVNKEILMVNETGVFVTSMSLLPGTNELNIKAMDDQNNLAEHTLIVEYQPPIITLEDKIKHESKYYGLLIGVNDYMDENMEDLDNPIRDAENLYHTLSRKYTFNPEQLTILRNPTRAEIISALDDLRKQVSEKDNVLIFYAGHGLYDEKAEIGYWLPTDAFLSATANWFRNSTLVDYLRAIESKHTLLISDACFAGSIFKSRSVSMPEEVIFEKIYELPSRKAMTSGTLTEVPDESAFIKYLIQRLEENNETYLSSEELYSSLRNAVISNSNVLPRYGEIQNVGNEGGDFIFLKRK